MDQLNDLSSAPPLLITGLASSAPLSQTRQPPSVFFSSLSAVWGRRIRLSRPVHAIESHDMPQIGHHASHGTVCQAVQDARCNNWAPSFHAESLTQGQTNRFRLCGMRRVCCFLSCSPLVSIRKRARVQARSFTYKEAPISTHLQRDQKFASGQKSLLPLLFSLQDVQSRPLHPGSFVPLSPSVFIGHQLRLD